MSGLILPRRRFLAGLAGILAAPAIVRASSLMPVKAYAPEPPLLATYTWNVSGHRFYDDGRVEVFHEQCPVTRTESGWHSLDWTPPTDAGLKGVRYVARPAFVYDLAT